MHASTHEPILLASLQRRTWHNRWCDEHKLLTRRRVSQLCAALGVATSVVDSSPEFCNVSRAPLPTNHCNAISQLLRHRCLCCRADGAVDSWSARRTWQSFRIGAAHLQMNGSVDDAMDNVHEEKSYVVAMGIPIIPLTICTYAKYARP